jgi:GT2 family glycosyltransferase
VPATRLNRPEFAADLAVIVVSTNEAHWLGPCLTSVFAHAADAKLDVIVVDNESTDGTRELVESNFERARVITSPNRGFGYANNRGLETTSARYVLFLNPDTEILEGTFSELIAVLDARPEVGIVGVRQLTPDRILFPTIRRFPSVSRALGEALGSERWPVQPAWAGERVLDRALYEQDVECDWMSGSFMLARRRALLSAGLMDERFFIYSEEPDLCLRIKRAGWSARHLPQMTIIHHACKGGIRPRMIAQDAFARRQYAQKHFVAPQRALYLFGLAARHVIRAASATVSGEDAELQRKAAQRAIRTLMGRSGPPFGAPPATALAASASPNVAIGLDLAPFPVSEQEPGANPSTAAA